MLTKAYNPYFGRYGGRGMIGLFPLILKDCIKKIIIMILKLTVCTLAVMISEFYWMIIAAKTLHDRHCFCY